MKYSQAVLVAVVGGAVLAAAAPAASSTSTAPAVQPTQQAPLSAPAAGPVAQKANVAKPKGTKPHHVAHPGEQHRGSGQHHAGASQHPKKKVGSRKSTVAKSKPVTPDAATTSSAVAKPSAAAPAVAGRDVDELEARGVFEGLFGAFRKNKGAHKHGKHHHKDKEAHKSATPAAAPSAAPSPAANPAPPAENAAPAPESAQAPLAGREFFDEEDLFEREFEDDVFERDIDEDLEARLFKGMLRRLRGKKAPTPSVDPSQLSTDQQPAVRSFDDEDVFERDIDEDLEARFFKGMLRRLRGKKAPTAAVDPSQLTDQQQPAVRSFDDEDIFERDINEDLEARLFKGMLRRLRGKKASTPSVNPTEQPTEQQQRSFDEDDVLERDLYDEEDLFERDLYDEEDLFEREYLDEEDLMARGIDVVDAIQAIKKTYGPTSQPRDFYEHLDLRGFELEELD